MGIRKVEWDPDVEQFDKFAIEKCSEERAEEDCGDLFMVCMEVLPAEGLLHADYRSLKDLGEGVVFGMYFRDNAILCAAEYAQTVRILLLRPCLPRKRVAAKEMALERAVRFGLHENSKYEYGNPAE
jgi:hypothetical protein